MHPQTRNNIRKFPSERRKGLTGTVIIHLVLFSLLILVGFSVPPPHETDEGIMVNFGTDETGLGMIEPSPPAVLEQTTSSPPPAETAAKTEEDPLLTQNTEEAPEVKKVDPEAEKKRWKKLKLIELTRNSLKQKG